MNKTESALRMALEAMNECRFDDRWYAAKEAIKEALQSNEQDTCKGCNGNGVVGNILDTAPCPFCKGSGVEAQPEQESNKDGSPCPEFWDWLPKAYNFEGDGNFTKYNMEVAFLAGKQASQPEQEYKRGYADAMNWKVQNHLEHLPPKEPEQDGSCTYCTDGCKVCDAKHLTEQEPVACVYKATTKKGETAHFGEYSAAKAWAGWGTVEQVPLKTLTLISKSIDPCPTCEALARTVMLDQTSHDTTQPQRTWVGLTEDEAFACKGRDYFETYKAIEAKLKEKNIL